jgi:hypothetical protein
MMVKVKCGDAKARGTRKNKRGETKWQQTKKAHRITKTNRAIELESAKFCRPWYRFYMCIFWAKTPPLAPIVPNLHSFFAFFRYDFKTKFADRPPGNQCTSAKLAKAN